MADDLKTLSVKIVESALKVIMPSSGDRIEGIAGSDVRGLTSMAAFSALPGLKELTINDVRTIDDWSGLASLRRLERLDLSGSSVSDLEFARGITGLRPAALNGCVNLADVDGLAGSPVLSRVTLQGIGGQLASSVDRLTDRAHRGPLEIDYDPFGNNDFAGS